MENYLQQFYHQQAKILLNYVIRQVQHYPKDTTFVWVVAIMGQLTQFYVQKHD